MFSSKVSGNQANVEGYSDVFRLGMKKHGEIQFSQPPTGDSAAPVEDRIRNSLPGLAPVPTGYGTRNDQAFARNYRESHP